MKVKILWESYISLIVEHNDQLFLAVDIVIDPTIIQLLVGGMEATAAQPVVFPATSHTALIAMSVLTPHSRTTD
jgi:hypothetical protein